MLSAVKRTYSRLKSGKLDPSQRTGAVTLVRRRGHRLRNIGLGTLVVLVTLVALGFFAVPPLAKYYAVKTLSEQLDRDVAIRDIEFNPLSLNARVLGLTIHERRSAQTFIALDELLLNLEYRSLLRRAPVLKRVTLVRPYVHIARNLDGSGYNFSDLLAKFSKPATPQRSQNTPRFSLNNIQLVNGRLDFDDHPKRARHVVSEVEMAIPFISNLPDVVDLYVQPAFSARVNGTPVALYGRTKPFKETRETSIDLNIEHLELARYVEYLPINLGFQLASGLLDARLTASFVREHSGAPLLKVRGDFGVEKLSIRELTGAPLLNLAALNVPVTGIDVLERRISLGNIALTSPEFFVRRDKDGGVNWVRVRPSVEAPAPKAAETTETPPITLTVAELAIHDGLLHVDDRVPTNGFRSELSAIQASMHELALPQAAPAQIDVSFNTSLGETVKVGASVLVDPLSAEGSIELSKIRLRSYESYYQDLIAYRLEDGIADFSSRYAFTMGTDGPKVKLSELNLALASVRLRKPGEQEDFLRSRSVQIRNASVDVDDLALSVGQMIFRDGLLNLIRGPDGVLNAARLLPAPKSPSTKRRQGNPWLITLQQAQVEKWKISFTDLTNKQPVKIVVDDLRFSASGLTNRKDAKGKVTLQGKINETGAIKISGATALNPVDAQLDVELERIGLLPLQPYFTDKVNILISSGNLSAKGNGHVALAGDRPLSASFNGDVSFSDVATVDKAKSEDLLKWQSLLLSGVKYEHAPTSLTIEQVALADFFARIIIFPEGRLNLQNIAAQSAPDPKTEKEQDDTGKVATRNGTAAVPGSAAKGAATLTVPVTIGKVILQGGDVAFSDFFVKPNYSADLSDIGGSVSGLSSSQLDSAADVVLRGHFAKTAPVEIRGKVNPLLKDLVLDLKATVRDIELGPLTPYSGKYVGYAIEKGKMSFDVAYKVEHRKLTAVNRLVLNQLTFGGRIESPQATKLPVLLAVSLLKDRNGMIDVNLPISGSLDDPKFSIGGIVWHIIFNLIEKAVTSPFALIGNLVGGGGGEELSYLEFEDGRAASTTAGRDKLAKLQSALIERPGLRLDIMGHVDPTADRDGLRRARFEQQIKAQKLKELVKRGAAVQSVDAIKIEPNEYEKYLRAAYKDAKFQKPRNALGFTKDLPVDEMEKLMLANTVVTDDDLVVLANQRAQLAKDAITKDGKVALDRVYLLAPKLDAKGDDKRKGSRVDFALR